jgi:quercetin dioxygenase-like cupin family protein
MKPKVEFRDLLVDEHRLVVRRRMEEFFRIGEGPVDADADIDEREEGAIHGLLSRGSVGAERLSIGLGLIGPEEYHLKHHHPNGAEFYYGLSGEAMVYLDGQTVHMTAGTAIYIPPNCIHAIYNDSSTDAAELMWGIDAGEYKEVGLVYDE